MHSSERHVTPDSDYYIYEPSTLAREVYLYPLSSGHFRYTGGYRNIRRSFDSFELFCVEEGSVELKVSIDPEASMIVYTVTDTGIGIPPEESERIFEEFLQLDQYYDGTGIGLSVARSIAQRLGGNIWLDTTYTEGARFLFTLPDKQ